MQTSGYITITTLPRPVHQERVVLMLGPECHERRLKCQVMDMVSNAGVKVVCSKKMPEGAELKKMLDCMKRYKTRDSQKYYDLVEKMVRGPFEVLLLEGVNAFHNVNKVMGKTSEVDTIMGTYCWKRDPIESMRFAFVGETQDEVKMDIQDWFADIKI